MKKTLKSYEPESLDPFVMNPEEAKLPNYVPEKSTSKKMGSASRYPWHGKIPKIDWEVDFGDLCRARLSYTLATSP